MPFENNVSIIECVKKEGIGIMLRKVLTLLVILGMGASTSFASQNFLNSVVFENIDGQYNIILRSDIPAKVRKSTQGSDKVTLTIKGITSANNINTIYKNVNNINPLVVEATGENELKLHIQGENVANANIIFNTPDSAPIFVGERFGHEKTSWALTVFALAGIILYSTNRKTRKVAQKRELRDREIEFYKAKLPSMNYKPTYTYSMNTIKKETIIR